MALMVFTSKTHNNKETKRKAMDIILASGSPRRRELLTNAQVNFRVISVDIDETAYHDESPTDYIQRMVASKATAAIEQLNAQLDEDVENNNARRFALSSSFMILTADTIGVLADGKTVLVKPIDCDHAYDMWQKMSDNTHQVWTSVQATEVSLLTTDSNKWFFKSVGHQRIIERTEVTFVPLTSVMMTEYWNSGEPADKAGGYGIQGLAAAWVTHINGSYTNVVGLPLAQTLALINKVNKNQKYREV